MKTNIEKFNTFSLRVRKAAKTKIEILKAFLELLQSSSLDTMKVEDICRRVEISHKTFFNYFEKKELLLSYFIQLHSYEMGYISSLYLKQTKKPLFAIREIFKQTALGLKNQPQIMLELICLQTSTEVPCSFEVSEAEKLYFFQDIPNIELYEDGGLDYLIPSLLQEAKDLKQLKNESDIEFIYLEIMSSFYGSSILALRRDPKQYAEILDKMIENTLAVYILDK